MEKIAIVTGANRGLGRKTSEELAKLGYHVVKFREYFAKQYGPSGGFFRDGERLEW